MDRYRPRPARRRAISRRAQGLVTALWIIASLAVPVAGAVVITDAAADLLPPEDSTTYTVRAGDTLGAIARRFGVTVDDIVAANGLANADVIYVGQVLVIPQQAPQDQGFKIHTVQAGESLAMIARRYGVTTDAIMQANNLPDLNSISAGQELRIPAAATADTGRSLTYIVQRGDSLYRIALTFGVSVDDLLAANSLAGPNAIYPGLALRIPAPPSADSTTGSPTGDRAGGRTHVVAPGESLSQIAIAFNVTVDGIVAANDLSRPDRIYPGQLLNIPDPGAVARNYPAQAAVTHVIRPGETLAAIAYRYGVTVHALAVANGISNPSRIVAGRVLSIPSATAGSNSVAYASAGPGLCAGVEPERTGTGYFARPVRGYFLTQRFHDGHSGIDLALDEGEPVYAADGGTVVYAGWNNAGYGNLIVLDHGNGWRTYYAHLSAVHITCGEWIPRGSLIGDVGSTGNSTGPHLHFELLRFGIAINPAGYIRF